MCATMAVTMLAGCGNGSKNGTEAADGEQKLLSLR